MFTSTEPQNYRRDVQEMFQLVAEGKLRPQVSATMSFTDGGVQGAFRHLRSRRVVGKVAVDLSRLEDEDPG